MRGGSRKERNGWEIEGETDTVFFADGRTAFFFSFVAKGFRGSAERERGMRLD